MCTGTTQVSSYRAAATPGLSPHSQRVASFVTSGAGVVSPEKYGIVIGKAWIASTKLLQLAENEADPLLARIRDFLHDPHREQKGCEQLLCACLHV